MFLTRGADSLKSRRNSDTESLGLTQSPFRINEQSLKRKSVFVNLAVVMAEHFTQLSDFIGTFTLWVAKH